MELKCSDCQVAVDRDGICPQCGAFVENTPAAASAPVSSATAGATVTIPSVCTEPGCGGKVTDQICEKCGTFIDGTAQPAPSAATAAMNVNAVSARSRISAHPSSIASVAGTAGTTVKRTRKTETSAHTSRGLGSDLVVVSPQLAVDPMSLVRLDLVVPEAQRTCANPKCRGLCENASCPGVESGKCSGKNHGRPVQFKLDKGFCGKCRTPYNFTPIPPGTLVSSQYRVKGPLAIGGCGFVYVAYDENVGQWVILKGIINSLDPAAMQAAVEEKSYLSNLRDPQIVNIVNFVTHEGNTFIVMEFVDGVTLKSKRKHEGPLKVEDAIWAILNVLPGFSFLHGRDITYCDGKLDNFMLQGSRVRIIDMGGCRKKDDPDADVYFTFGYCAPEAKEHPSIPGDIFTLGRCLALLLFDFDWQGKHEHTIPTPDEVPLLAQYESLYRFLLRATAQNPDDRFQSAEEMANQLYGVLREVVAINSKAAHPADSTLFRPATHNDEAVVGYQTLPALLVDQLDPAQSVIEQALGLPDKAKRKSAFEQTLAQQPDSREAGRRLAELLTDEGAYEDAQKLLDSLLASDAYDWRVIWLRGRLLLAQGDAKGAYRFFDAVYSELPGELAPKLALAVVAEMTGDLPSGARLYDLVSGADPVFTAAAFGLARCLAAAGDRTNAVKAYDRVAPSSVDFVDAMMQRTRTLIEGKPTVDDLSDASQTLSTISGDNFALSRLRADLLRAAIGQFGGGTPVASFSLLGKPADPDDLRAQAEKALRNCARFARTKQERYALIDEANDLRPLTRV